MKINKTIRLKNSVFIKLLLIIFLTGFLINIMVALFFRFHISSDTDGAFRKNIFMYGNYLIDDIGIPPDTNKAGKIAVNNSLYISIFGKGFQWKSAADAPGLDDVKKYHYKDVSHGVWRRGMFIVPMERNGVTFIFATARRRFRFGGKEPVIFLVIFLTVVVAGAYFSIRRILRGIRLLSLGVGEISRGNFDFRIPVTGRDELAELGTSFNSMSSMIKEMLRIKGQLLLDVSHELRSPLTRMKVGLEFLPEGRARESIAEDINDIEKMVTELLESERLNAPHGGLVIRPGDAAELLREIAGSFGNRKPGIVLRDIPGMVMTDMDRERTGIVIKNVIENAVKFSGEGSEPVEIFLEEKADTFSLTIKDYGSGIAPDDLPFVFEPFYRADRSRSRSTGGYGLGLSLCRKIMEAQGGSIGISSIPGEGTTVFLKFNRSRAFRQSD